MAPHVSPLNPIGILLNETMAPTMAPTTASTIYVPEQESTATGVSTSTSSTSVTVPQVTTETTTVPPTIVDYAALLTEIVAPAKSIPQL
eukprot:2005986-Prymnesium_polylepis.1